MLEGLTIACDAKRTDGSVCGATARVLDARHEYAQHDPQAAAPYPELISVSVEIDCPQCGRRTQVLLGRAN
jgi:hypothetical protein